MRYVELFCGCGGSGRGLTEAGWECALAVDNDPFALQLYRDNLPSHPTLLHDLRQPLPAVEGRVDAVVGGAPCQDFTNTGTRRKKRLGERAALTEAFGDRVAALLPAWVVFENVRCAERRPQFLALRERLEGLGYFVAHRVVSTADLGMAQTRFRLVLIAHASRERVEAAWRAMDGALHGAGRRETMRQLFARYGLDVPTDHVFYPSACPDPRWMQSVFPLDGPSPTIRGRARPIPSSYHFRDRDSIRDRSRVTALRTEHLLALQGFPPDFRWSGGCTRTNQCVGNAVPIPLARAVAEAIDIAEAIHAATG